MVKDRLRVLGFQCLLAANTYWLRDEINTEVVLQR